MERTNVGRTKVVMLALWALAMGSACAGASTREPNPDAGLNPQADPGPAFAQSPGWSARKRLRDDSGRDLLLEEQLTGFAAVPGASRVRSVRRSDAVEYSWTAPEGQYISDIALHPSGAVSAALVGLDFHLSLARLSPELDLLALEPLSDPAVASDPQPLPPIAVDLLANPLPRDPARLAADGEVAVLVVHTNAYAAIGYRFDFTDRWQPPLRMLIQPVTAQLPFLPIGGSFNTFGAMWSQYRTLVDVDSDGNAYFAAWADRSVIKNHVALFHDGLSQIPNPENPLVPDSDVLLNKFDRSGNHLWSRVVGTPQEDEPYAIRASQGQVAVVGRSRRFVGFDNTFWDAFLSVSAADGTLVGTRAFQLTESSIFMGVAGLGEAGWVMGGSDGWAQNPSGLSVLSFGTKLLLSLSSLDAEPVRVPLTPGPRHNEIHTVLADAGRVWFAGHEDGPVMHTGDADPTLIHATGVYGFLDH